MMARYKVMRKPQTNNAVVRHEPLRYIFGDPDTPLGGKFNPGNWSLTWEVYGQDRWRQRRKNQSTICLNILPTRRISNFIETATLRYIQTTETGPSCDFTQLV